MAAFPQTIPEISLGTTFKLQLERKHASKLWPCRRAGSTTLRLVSSTNTTTCSHPLSARIILCHASSCRTVLPSLAKVQASMTAPSGPSDSHATSPCTQGKPVVMTTIVARTKALAACQSCVGRIRQATPRCIGSVATQASSWLTVAIVADWYGARPCRQLFATGSVS